MRKMFATAALSATLLAGMCSPSFAADPTIAAAGDISALSGTTGAGKTAKLLVGKGHSRVLTLGDNQYDTGALAKFNTNFEATWGQVKSIISPSPGNHDYKTAGASGYKSYFGTAARPSGVTYYSYNIGSWHIISLDSNCADVSCATGSAQEKWLRADLAANTKPCVAAYFHHPRFSSGSHHGNQTQVTPFWKALWDFRADVVLSGHEHNYERFAPQRHDGTADAAGIREFVVGTGGVGLYSFGTAKPNSQVRRADALGVLTMTLQPSGYAWKFIKADGTSTGVVLDSGTDTCNV